MSKFSKIFIGKSPLKDTGHRGGDKPHAHPDSYYTEQGKEVPGKEITVASDDEAKRLTEGNRTSAQTATLLKHINAARKEQGLPPVDNLEEGLKTTPSGG